MVTRHWPVYHVDFDKSHRCPAMGADWHAGVTAYVPYSRDGHRWRVYRCAGCGLRVARWPLLPHYPGEWHVFTGVVTWRQRRAWFIQAWQHRLRVGNR
jgi:hypothetical protein